VGREQTIETGVALGALARIADHFLEFLVEKLEASRPVDISGHKREAKLKKRLKVGLQSLFPRTIIVGHHSSKVIEMPDQKEARYS
jgi:hypothetical protein